MNFPYPNLSPIIDSASQTPVSVIDGGSELAPPADSDLDTEKIVYAQIRTNDSQPIPEVMAYILNPGVTYKDWIASNWDKNLLFTSCQSNSEGMCYFTRNLRTTDIYSLAVYKQGYQLILKEDLSLLGKPKPTVKLDITLAPSN